ncbi:MAG: helix-turn-helix transcriptional regulator [Alphaproteobacteria bacterium]|nr:helix-turn-helix transcriptional regulator [Alphaproteobacteria bacterium]
MMDEPCDRLKLARERAGLSGAKEASDKFGWNENTYKSHENGNRGIPLEAAKKYGRAFQVLPWWILTGAGDDLLAEADELVEPRSILEEIFLAAHRRAQVATRPHVPVDENQAQTALLLFRRQLDEYRKKQGGGR